jgi:hypothetical protein
MPYVLTADQIDSRLQPDRVPAAMAALADRHRPTGISRTVGDEFEVLFGTESVFEAESVSVVAAILSLMREGTWHVGVGIGPVDKPTPTDLREARGPAFLAARRAVEEAKGRADHLRVISVPPTEDAADDAETVLALVLALRARRSSAGWIAADLADQGLTQAEIGVRLGISRQAVGQRLQAAQWSLDRDARPVAARLLDRAERRASRDRDAG